MIRVVAKEPLARVATSFVDAKRTVVVYKSTFSTNQVDDPSLLVLVAGSEIAIRSPISYGRRIKMKRIPCNYHNNVKSDIC